MKTNELKIFTEHESQVRSYCRSFPKIFSRAVDSYLYDVDGSEYIDFLSGSGSLNFGHNNSEIKKAVSDYIDNDGILFSLDMHTEAKKRFISHFQEFILAPRKLNYRLQFTSPSGTSAVESAIKLARKYTGRQNIIGFTNAYHGMTATSLSLTGNSSHRQAHSQGNITLLPYDGYLGRDVDSLSYYRKLLSDPSSGVDLPAAIILEAVQGEGGINTASTAWLQGVKQISEEFNIQLIVDDIQAGCGRCGQFFSFEEAGIKPDIVCLSKSIGGIGFPFSLVLINPEADVWSVAEDNGTFRGNNLAFVAAARMIELYWSDDKFEKEIAIKSDIVRNSLIGIAERYSDGIVECRGRGLMQGIEFRNSEDTKAVADRCFENNVIIEKCGPRSEVLKLMPALTIDSAVLAAGLAVIERAVEDVFASKLSAVAL